MVLTNKDKYLKDGVDVEELTDKFNDWHLSNSNVTNYGEALYRFLQAEIKPTLTEDEKVILRELMGCENYIGRKDDGTLYLKTVAGAINYFGFYLHLFKFIKKGEEYEISDLLEE